MSVYVLRGVAAAAAPRDNKKELLYSHKKRLGHNSRPWERRARGSEQASHEATHRCTDTSILFVARRTEALIVLYNCQRPGQA